MDWIPVKERLPERDGAALVFARGICHDCGMELQKGLVSFLPRRCCDRGFRAHHYPLDAFAGTAHRNRPH